MPSELPIWATLSLRQHMTLAQCCAQANALGVRADVVSGDLIQFPSGFLAWIEPAPFPEGRLDLSVAAADPEIGPCCLHISGGTNELERQSHYTPLELRQQIRDKLDAITAPPNEEIRIVSAAARKVERLTVLLRGLAPMASALILPQANNIAFDTQDFLEQSESYVTEGGYHFPLYVYCKVRPEPDGPFVCTSGMSLFALPEAAMPLTESLPTQDAVLAIGELQREMVAEGWWPHHGATFTSSIGPLRIESVQDALFVLPSNVPMDRERVDVARHRLALERCARGLLGSGTMHRVRTPQGLVVDHHIVGNGTSYAISNGISLWPQRGGTAEQGNERVEVIVFSNALGPWATWWVSWLNSILRAHDGSHPVHAYDRLALPEPRNGVAAAIVWPWGTMTPYGNGGMVVNLWGLLPILEEELARFRAVPESHGAWLDEREARRDLDEILKRWLRVVPAEKDQDQV